MRSSRRFIELAAISLTFGVSTLPAVADDAGRSPAGKRNLAFVLDFWNNVFMKRDASRFAEFSRRIMSIIIPTSRHPGCPVYSSTCTSLVRAAPAPRLAPRRNRVVRLSQMSSSPPWMASW